MTERRLATILALDVVNFSKLMSEDEVRTLENLGTARALIDASIDELSSLFLFFEHNTESALISFARIGFLSLVYAITILPNLFFRSIIDVDRQNIAIISDATTISKPS